MDDQIVSSLAEKSQSKYRLTVLFTTLMAALAGLMFGLDIGVISGATQFIQSDFHVSNEVIEWIVSSMMVGAAVGALLAGQMAYAIGRKKSLIISSGLFVVGSIFCGLSQSPTELIASRVVLGLAIGVATFAAPLYLAEVGPKENRGAMISTYQLMITIGILIAFLSDTAFSYSGNWRWMLGVLAIPGVLLLAGVSALPCSPRWLMMRGKRGKAADVLRKLRGDEASVAKEIQDIEQQLRIPQRGWKMFLSNRNFRRSVALGVLLQAMQQFTGMNVVMYYAPRIFKSIGYASTADMWFTVIVGLTNVIATFIAIGLVDRVGRKPILYSGFSVMAVGLGVVGLMMHLGIHEYTAQIFTVVMLLVFIVGFAMSAGPLIWTLCSEIQPLKGRNFGIGVSTVTNWIANMIVGATFLSLLTGIGDASTFWLYAGLNALFLVFTILLVPETKGIALEDIERNLMKGLKLRRIGR